MPIMADEIEWRRTADNLECVDTGYAVVTKSKSSIFENSRRP